MSEPDDKDAGPAGLRPGAAQSSRGQWIAWQREHEQALAALQEAERAYHRTIAASAFQTDEDPSAVELQRDALKRLEQARVALDAIRHRQPE